MTYLGPQLLPAANPSTLYQIVAAANTPVALKSIELMPLGSTAATPPLLFDLATQTDAGGLLDDTANLISNLGAVGAAKQTTILKRNGAEPAGPVTQYLFSLHQQGTRVWVPPNADREIVIPHASRLGVRFMCTTYVNVRLQIELEE
jgi:hypothetical protein